MNEDYSQRIYGVARGNQNLSVGRPVFQPEAEVNYRLDKSASNHLVYDVKNDDDQTVVAWQDNKAPRISAFKKQSSDQTGMYRVRFFCHRQRH